MKIALIALHFKPDQAVGAVRPENWANWLADGHDVTVITRERLDQIEDNEQRYSIIRPKSFSIRLLERFNEYRKARRAIRWKNNSKASAEPSFQRNSGAFAYRMPCLYDIWFFSCYNALCKTKPELIIATHSPYISLVAAYAYVARHPETKLWLDFRDLWTKNHVSIGLPFFRWIESWLEKRMLCLATAVTTVSNHLAEELREASSKHVVTIYNSCPTFETVTINSSLPRDGAISICYTGTVYRGWQDPSPLFSAIAKLRDEGQLQPEQLKVDIASRNPGNLLQVADRYRMQDFLAYHGAVSRQQALTLQREADILLLLESPSPEARGVLTGKVFEYLATDKPVLLIGPGPDAELYQLLARHQRLITIDDLVRAVKGEASLPTMRPVDYSEISKQTLLELVETLD
ncbi:MAG: glycosyltransferase [Gammaproteobacteria bacterium]